MRLASSPGGCSIWEPVHEFLRTGSSSGWPARGSSASAGSIGRSSAWSVRSENWNIPLLSFSCSFKRFAMAWSFCWLSVWLNPWWFWNSLSDTDLIFSLATRRSRFRWVTQMIVRDSFMMTWQGPTHRPFSSMFGALRRSQIMHSSPHFQSCSRPLDCLSNALRIALELSASRSAFRASVRIDIFFWKRSDWVSSPSSNEWVIVDSSLHTDPGNLLARPRTACSGLNPFATLMLFLAWKHCSRA